MHGAMGERSRARANLAFASLERGLSVLIDRRHRVLLARGASLCGGREGTLASGNGTDHPAARNWAKETVIESPKRFCEWTTCATWVRRRKRGQIIGLRLEATASMRTMSAPRVRSARASCEAPAGHPRQTPSPRPGIAKDSSRQSARSRRAVPEVPTATGRGATRCPRPGRRIQRVRAPSPRPARSPRPQRRHPSRAARPDRRRRPRSSSPRWD